MVGMNTVTLEGHARREASLEVEATGVLARLRDALVAVIEAQPGADVRKAADVHKVFKLDRALGWALYRVAMASHPLDAGPYVPGKAPMKRFVDGARRAGTPEQLLDQVVEAFEAFEQLVDQHAGDREAFESMIVHSDKARRDAADLKHKREAFRSNGHLWGVQSRATLITSIVAPSRQADTVDLAMIRGSVGHRQLRPETPAHATMRWFTGTPPAPSGYIEQPIDPASVVEGGIGLLSKFCSQPLPRFRTHTDLDGYTRADLISEGVGNSAALTYFIGTVVRGAPPPIPAGGEGLAFANRLRRPTESLVLDLLVHRSLWNGPRPEVRVCSGDGGITEKPSAWEAEALPIRESVVEIDRGLDAVGTPEIPRYREMLEHTFNCLQWTPGQFRIFRCRIEYPIIHSVIRLFFPSKQG